MKPDFSLKKYKELLNTLSNQGFSFLTFSEYLLGNSGQKVILRHDVDRFSGNSLKFAEIENKLEIKGTYYFRVIQNSLNEEIIRNIAELGHEVGYHYEDLSLAAQRLKAEGGRQKERRVSEIQRLRDNNAEHGTRNTEQLFEAAIDSFGRNLEKLRKYADVKTICMHGSPMSRWDSRLLWKYYDYHNFGIIGEPYFDINFDEVLYLTDTGRRWDGENVAVRDKAESRERRAGSENPYKDWKVKPVKYRLKTKGQSDDVTERLRDSETEGEKNPATSNQQPTTLYHFHSTHDIIKAANENRLPDKIMITFHPQRWTDKPLPWAKELVWQNVKNIGKYFLVRSMK